MPKNIIVSAEQVGTNVETSEKVSKPEMHVEVSWGRGTSVQIGTTNPALPQFENGWFVDLGLDEINLLIRTLKRARQQAYLNPDKDAPGVVSGRLTIISNSEAGDAESVALQVLKTKRMHDAGLLD